MLGALNRVFINIGLFSEEWLLHFNPLVGGKKITPIQNRGRRKKFQLLERHRGADSRRRTVLPQDGQARSAQGCSRRQRISDRGQSARSTAARLRSRNTCARCHSSKIPEAPATVDESELGSILGLDQDRRLQAKDDRHRHGRRFSDGQLSLHRTAHSRHLASDQRVQSAGNQRPRRQYLGQFLIADL